MDSTNEVGDAAAAQRPGFLKCMLWACSGAPAGRATLRLLVGSAMAATLARGELTLVQISDSHTGFSGPPNTDTAGTLREPMERVTQLKGRSSLLLDTGDVS